MLKHRLISSFILILVASLSLFFLSPIKFAIAVLIVCILAAFEWGKLSGFTSCKERILLGLLCGLLLSGILFLLPEYYPNIYQLLVTIFLLISLVWWILAFLLVLFYPNSAVIWKNSKILRLMFGLLTIIPFFEGMLVLRNWDYNASNYNGVSWLLYVMILVWGVDSSSYIFGTLCGNYKIVPKISPRKTKQGFVSGLVTSIFIALSYSILVHLDIPLFIFLICSIITSLASILGDLTQSMLKREAGIKDSGNLIPGHGGILDRIDSLTAAVPVFTCLLFLIFKKI